MIIDELENKRQDIQGKLDRKKSLKERNELGQFSTPHKLAIDMLAKAKLIIPKNETVKFLDPAIGTGVFYSACVETFEDSIIEKAKGYEIDPHFGEPAKQLWKDLKLDYEIEDFTSLEYPKKENERYNLIVCNPPYVRHHHINGQKRELQIKSKEYTGIQISTLAGLYCYFIMICHKWMTNSGIGVWLIPSEFMEVNYGRAIKEYLTTKVSLLQIHRFAPDDLQFSDALVTSSVMIIKNKKPDSTDSIKFTYGKSLLNPELSKDISISDLKIEWKWTRFPQNELINSHDYPKLKDFFKIKRGIATGDNSFFILEEGEIIKRNLPRKFFKPILPSPRYLSETIIDSDKHGNPKIGKKLFVLDCKKSMDEIKGKYPSLYAYLNEGISNKVTERYICKNRKLWYAQENRAISDFFFTYIGRGNNSNNSFRFILNNSNSIASNSYLMLYAKDPMLSIIKEDEGKRLELLKLLNEITQSKFLEQGRVYGGGMRKFEPKELSEVNSVKLIEFIDRNTA